MAVTQKEIDLRRISTVLDKLSPEKVRLFKQLIEDEIPEYIVWKLKLADAIIEEAEFNKAIITIPTDTIFHELGNVFIDKLSEGGATLGVCSITPVLNETNIKEGGENAT